MIELDNIERLAASSLDGYLVRKDLVQTFSRQFPVPTYVLEFLLGNYYATTDPDEIEEGLDVVQRQLKSLTVKAGEEELFEARARENGEVKIIDSECWSQLRNQSRISLLQNKVYFGGALGRRATNAVNKTLSEWLKLLYTQREMMTCPMR